MAIQITQLHQADILVYIEDLLETATHPSSRENTEQYTFELNVFTKLPQRKTTNKPWEEEKKK
ncbi:hypothetical protein ACI1VM_24490, partial [Escherichia coli]